MKPKICLSIEDGYADAYAMHTLYTYLMENNFDSEFKVYSHDVEHLLKFNQCIRDSRVGEEFKSDRVMLVDERERWPDVILGGFSDVNNYLSARPERTIAIDHSVLKNCVKLTTKEQKAELRKKYNIQEDKPVVVIGFPTLTLNCYDSLEKVLKNIHEDASIYLVGSVNLGGQGFNTVHPMAKIFSERGTLKDYYTMADVAMMYRNIYPYDTPYHLHNFIEATVGGPLFLVTPRNKAQYGYRQLVERDVIREAENTDDLIAKVKNYLQNSEEEKVREQRTQHLEQSRNLYLPDILRLINRVLENSNKPFQSDLLAEIIPPKRNYFSRVYTPKIAVHHPQTLWDLTQTKPLINLQKIPKKLYEAFGRER